jgi:apolipoprotein N-acyltransferase
VTTADRLSTEVSDVVDVQAPPPVPVAARRRPFRDVVRDGPGGRRSRLLGSAAAGLAMALAFPPVEWVVLAVPGMAVLLWAWRGATPRQAAGAGLVAGIAFFGVVMEWIRYFGAIAVVPLLLLLAAYWALAGFAVATLARWGVRSPWITGAVWVATEAGRGRWPFGGLTWGELGYAFHDVAWARHVASVGSVRLDTFLAVVLAGLLVDLVAWRSGDARRVAGRRFAAATVALVAIGLVAGLVRPTLSPTRTLRVAAVQGNDLNRDLTIDEIRADLLASKHFALADTITGPVDLVVFPESSMDHDPQRDPDIAEGIQRTAVRLDTFVIANSSVVPLPDGRRANTNFFFAPDGLLVGSFSKQHLVPFGEYLPLRSMLGWIGATEQIGRDTAPGANRAQFLVRGVAVATMICFESAFSEIARANVRDGAEVLVLTTNNRSYRRSANSEQHVAMSQMRAAETGRPLVHSSISGSTAVIDEHGRVLSRTALFENGVTVADVTGRTGETLFVRFGDWVVYAALVVVAVAVCVGAARRRRGPARPADWGDA